MSYPTSFDSSALPTEAGGLGDPAGPEARVGRLLTLAKRLAWISSAGGSPSRGREAATLATQVMAQARRAFDALGEHDRGDLADSLTAAQSTVTALLRRDGGAR